MESEAHVGVIVLKSDDNPSKSIYVVPESRFNEAELTETKEDTSEFVESRYSQYRQDFIDFPSVDEAVTKFFVITKPLKDSLTLTLQQKKKPPQLKPEDYLYVEPWIYMRPETTVPSNWNECYAVELQLCIGENDDDDGDDVSEQSKE